MKDIIIDTENRFIGRHNNHRISIVRLDNLKLDNMFDMDIKGDDSICVMEGQMIFNDMEKAKGFCVGYIDKHFE